MVTRTLHMYYWACTIIAEQNKHTLVLSDVFKRIPHKSKHKQLIHGYNSNSHHSTKLYMLHVTQFLFSHDKDIMADVYRCSYYPQQILGIIVNMLTKFNYE